MRKSVSALAAAVVSLTFCTVTFCTTISAQDDAAKLLKLAPDHSNAIQILRISKSSFLAEASGVPTWVALAVRASQYTAGSREPNWTAGLAPKPADVSVESIAKMMGTTTETIAGKVATRTPRGHVAEVAPGVMGILTPDRRQDFARWLRSLSQSGRGGPSAYLLEVAGQASAPVTMALDLEDMLDPGLLAQRVESLSSLPAGTAASDNFLKLVTSTRGVRLSVLPEKGFQAVLQVDFATPVAAAPPALRELIIQILGDLGASVEELETAAVTHQAKSVSYLFTLPEDTVRHLLTLFVAPATMPSAAEMAQPNPSPPTPPSPTTPTTEPSRTAHEASLKYFMAIDDLVLSLQRRSKRSSNYLQTAVWHTQAAERIRQLPITGVDRELIDYGAAISHELAMLASLLRGVPKQVNVLEQGITQEVSSSAWWGPSGVWTVDGYHPAPWEIRTNLPEVRANQARVMAESAGQRDEIWRSLIDFRTRTRANMYEKFGVDFGTPGN